MAICPEVKHLLAFKSMLCRQMSVRNDKIILNRARITEIPPRLILVYSLEFNELDFPKEISVWIRVAFAVSFRSIL